MTKNKKISESTQVRHTGDWSADSKLASIKNGYWNDSYFEQLNGRSSVPNRTSLICRGYYVRFRVCDYFLRKLIDSINGSFQIVSLGSGMDTTFFRLLPNYKDRMTGFFEVDFPAVIANKLTSIQNHPELSTLSKDRLRLVAADLRNLDDLFLALKTAGIDLRQPTIFYSECVVNYLKPIESEAILPWITSHFESAIWMAYEQCFPNDAFGRVMVDHFNKNGCPIRSIENNGCMNSQLNQLKRANFRICSVLNAWDAFLELTQADGSSIPTIVNPQQQFDEYEALIATCLHYSVRIGITAKLSQFGSFQFIASFDCQRQLSEMDEKSTKTISATDILICTVDEPLLRGQATVVTDEGGAILSLGGSDQTSKIVPSVISFHFSTSSSTFSVLTQISEGNDLLQRMYSAAAFVPSTKSIMLMGGRKSPLSPCSGELVVISTKNPETQINPREVHSKICYASVNSEVVPCARWRHGLIHYAHDAGNDCILLFGGKTALTTQTVLGDCWRFSCTEDIWTSISGHSSSPSARHSHSMCLDTKRKSIFLTGGVSSDDTRLCDDALWQYNYDTNIWTQWSNYSDVARKIGHIALVHKDTLLIIGGYGNQRDCSLEHFITTINLETKAQQQYELGLSKDVRFLPFGFSAHVVRLEPGEEDESLIVFGGGGNCFSFGSHYNKSCLMIKLPL